MATHPSIPSSVLRAIASACLLAFAGCNTLQLGESLTLGPEAWATAGGNAARTNAVEGAFAPPLERAWRYDADAAFGTAAVTAADGVLIVATKQGELHAIDGASGKKRGVGDLKHPVTGAPVLTSRVLYAPMAEGKRSVIAYDFDRGTRLWALRTAPVEAGLLLLGTTLIAADLHGIVHGVDRESGGVRWTAIPDSSASFFATPVALSANQFAVADDRGRVSVFDVANGQTVWSVDLDRPVYTTPAAAGNKLFVPTTRGALLALDASTGDIAWTLQASTATVRFSAPAATSKRVFVGASDGILRALDAASGEVVWSFQSDGNFASAPLVVDSVVYAGAHDEKLYALDAESGALLWQAELDGRIKSEPVLHDGILVVLAEPKFIYGYRVKPAGLEPVTAP